jgi:hypothetical protein
MAGATTIGSGYRYFGYGHDRGGYRFGGYVGGNYGALGRLK